ncbi:MAG: SAM-dependent methyltransferase [Acidimicrobiales bacterium]
MTRTPRAYFEDLYGRAEDPWELASSRYERRKYALTVAALPAEHYQSAFEPACSVGVLTAMLAPRCDRLLAVDQSPVAVAAARRRLDGVDRVTVEQRTLPEEWPAGPFDLVVLSEVAYYFDPDELGVLTDAATRSLQPGATVVAVHWRGRTDYPLTGDQTHELLGRVPGLVPAVSLVEDAFRLDVWRFGCR